MAKLKAVQPAVEQAQSILAARVDHVVVVQRKLEGVKAAMRDPQTGSVYTGWTHQRAIESVPKDDKTGAWGRLHGEWDRCTDNAGFVDAQNTFISRNDAEALWGVLTMEDIKDALHNQRTGGTKPRRP